MTRTTGEINAEVSEVATREKISAGVATQNAMRLSIKRDSPAPITPNCAKAKPAPITTKMIANPVSTSSTA